MLYFEVGQWTTGRRASVGRGATFEAFSTLARLRLSFLPGWSNQVLTRDCQSFRKWFLGRTLLCLMAIFSTKSQYCNLDDGRRPSLSRSCVDLGRRGREIGDVSTGYNSDVVSKVRSISISRNPSLTRSNIHIAAIDALH